METLLITDGNCAFCQRTAAKLANIVSKGWANAPSTQLAESYGLTAEQFEQSVWLIEFAGSDVNKYRGAKAVGKVLRMRGGLWGAVGWLTFIPPTSWVAAGLYRLVANNRKFFSRFV